MGLSKEEKKLFADISAQLETMKKPSAAQQYLDDQSMQAGQWLSGGDFRKTPNNMFMSIEGPTIENERRKVMMNSANEGTSALAAGGSDPTALGLNAQFLNDRWSRDSSANYQNQVANAANRVTGAIGQSADATMQRNNTLLQGQMGAMQLAPKKTSFWGDLLRGGLSIGASLAASYGGGGGGGGVQASPLAHAIPQTGAAL